MPNSAPKIDLKALRENAIALDQLGISPLGYPTVQEEKKRPKTLWDNPGWRAALTWSSFQ